MKQFITYLALLLLFVSPIYADDSNVYQNDSIQDAINNASDGDTIYVHQGIYRENLNITKQITLIGDSRHNTAIRANNTSKNVVSILSDNVDISDFLLVGANTSACGIRMYGSENCNIEDNAFIGNYAHVRGTNVSGTTIDGNLMFAGIYGVYIAYSADNIVSNNQFYNITQCAVCIEEYSDGNVATNNVVEKCGYGVHITFSNDTMVEGNNITQVREYGITTVDDCYNTVIENNLVTNGSYCGIALARSCINNRIANNEIRDNHSYSGILLAYESNNNTIEDNVIDSIIGYAGVLFFDQNCNNTVAGNVMRNCTQMGLWLHNMSSWNRIYNNDLSNNVNLRYSGENNWNTTISEGPNIIGGPYIGGNCWSHYQPKDSNGDGFGDEVFNIGKQNTDYLPLVHTVTICGDVDGNGQVSSNDVIEAYHSAVDPDYLLPSVWAADVDGNGRITANDVVEIYRKAVDPNHDLNCKSYLPINGGIKQNENNNSDGIPVDCIAPSGLSISGIGSC